MYKVLVVEDDSVIRSNIVEILNMYNYDTALAENGKEALEVLEQYQPDIILSDIMMPEMTGIELLETLSGKSNFNLIPFLFLTAKTDPSDVRLGMGLGADDYITKPVSHTDLIKAIEVRLSKIKKITSELKTTQSEPITDDMFIDRENLKSLLSKLTAAEIKVLRLMSDNLTSEEISKLLYNSRRTIENHKANITKKLEFNKKNEIKAFAVSCRLMKLFEETDAQKPTMS